MANVNGYDLTGTDLSQQALPFTPITKWGVFVPPVAGNGDAPSIANISPVITYTITPSTFLQFDVIDSGSAIALVVPVITLDPTVAGELIYDWAATTPAPNGQPPNTTNNAGSGVFAAAYALNSTITKITNGFRFRVRRLNGWATPPILRVFAMNALGNITTL